MVVYQGNWRINAPLVVSDTSVDEVIIMHHGTGHYFNCLGSAALIWNAIEERASLEVVGARLANAFDLDKHRALEVAQRFIGILYEHDLICQCGEGASATVKAVSVSGSFSEPEIGVHTDLADLLLLDPVHEVDEAGWPAPKPQTKAA